MRFCLIIVVLLSISAAARAAPDYREINRALAEEVIIPAYNQLESATSRQKNHWISACEEPAADALDHLQAAYQTTADAWAAVFHWTAGPITRELRRERFYHWPERGNAIDRALAALRAAANPDRLLPPLFAQASVAVQGLPALERLLYGDSDVTQDPGACEIGRTIAINLASIAAEVSGEWRGAVVDNLRRGTALLPYFGPPLAALNRLFTSILTGFIILKDQKLMPGLRFKIDNANPKMLEGWRSQRPLRNLKINIDTLAESLAVLSRHLGADHRERIRHGMARSQQLAAQLAPLISGVTDPAERRKIFQLIDSLTSNQNEIANIFNQRLGLTIGFNSLDGD
ncbi:MAG: imelysin family protein [Rhodospirillales bacterium]|nr:imelysin family protein [Rhodospirillales bacterium]